MSQLKFGEVPVSICFAEGFCAAGVRGAEQEAGSAPELVMWILAIRAIKGLGQHS